MPRVARHPVVMAFAKEASASVPVCTVDSTASSTVSERPCLHRSDCMALFGSVVAGRAPHQTRTEATAHCLKVTQKTIHSFCLHRHGAALLLWSSCTSWCIRYVYVCTYVHTSKATLWLLLLVVFHTLKSHHWTTTCKESGPLHTQYMCTIQPPYVSIPFWVYSVTAHAIQLHLMSLSGPQHWYPWFPLVMLPTDECVDSSDCSNNGICVDTQSTNNPRRHCFCYPGYHGPRCQFSEFQTSTCVQHLVWRKGLSHCHMRCETFGVNVYKHVTCLLSEHQYVRHYSWRTWDTFLQTKRQWHFPYTRTTLATNSIVNQ